jgi:predicted transcriptional regulator
MLKKGCRLALSRPDSTMRLVLSQIEVGKSTINDIVQSTKLRRGQVASAVYNLIFIGEVVKRKRGGRRLFVYIGDADIECGESLRGVNSIFALGKL